MRKAVNGERENLFPVLMSYALITLGMQPLSRIIARLKHHYGEAKVPAANTPFELVIWENACYLLTDERRLEVFEALRKKVGLSAAAILSASDEVLLPLAKRGGMRPETRVFRWREIARITQTQFAGDLNSILAAPYAQAKNALKQFPNIGDPGAEKILLLCGMASGLPLESNGLRVLVRIGFGRQQKNYGATYRSVQNDLQPDLPASADSLKEAHLLLRQHGKTLCKDKAPLCDQCPLSKGCDYATKAASSTSRAT
jgi:endonuclease III